MIEKTSTEIQKTPSSEDSFETHESFLELYPGVERPYYDYAAERQNIQSTNIIESTAHLVKGCLGAGIFGMHEAYMYGGLWTSFGLTIVTGVLIFYTMLMLVNSAQKMYVTLRVPRLSYPALAEVAVATSPVKCCRKYRKKFRYFVETLLFLQICSSCCIYQIMFAHTLKESLESLSLSIEKLQLNIRIYILIITVPLMMICMVRQLRFLAKFSLAADICIAIIIVITMFFTIKEISINPTERPAWKNFYGMFHCLGVCLYNMEGVTSVLPIENHMAKPKYFSTVLQFGMAVVILCVILVGTLGYLAWGEKCKTPITTHMSHDVTSILQVLQLLFAIMLGVTFSTHFWVAFRVVWYYLGKLWNFCPTRIHLEWFYRMLHVLFITSISLMCPNMIDFMSFMGAFFLAFTGFIFPASIDSSVTWREHKKGAIRWKLIRNLVIIFTGICLFFGAIVKVFYKMQ